MGDGLFADLRTPKKGRVVPNQLYLTKIMRKMNKYETPYKMIKIYRKERKMQKWMWQNYNGSKVRYIRVRGPMKRSSLNGKRDFFRRGYYNLINSKRYFKKPFWRRKGKIRKKRLIKGLCSNR